MATETKTPPATPEQVQALVGPEPNDNATLMALTRAEIDIQISTAKAYPRSLAQFQRDALTMATLDEETAEGMFYQLPRDGRMIEGPSVRLAEIAGSCWGNVRYGSRVIEVGDEYLVARGQCFDLQRNVAVEMDVRRRITNKYGKRFNQDMIQTTGLAACSVALRNAIFKVVPAAFIKPLMVAAKKVAAGDERTLAVRRKAALVWFEEKKVKREWVFSMLDVKGVEDIGLDELSKLQGIRNAVKDGETTLDSLFADIATGSNATKVEPDSLSSATIAAGVASGKDDAKEKPSAAPVAAPAAEAEAEEPKPKK